MGQSSTAQGGSGSFKDRKPIGEVRQISVFFLNYYGQNTSVRAIY